MKHLFDDHEEADDLAMSKKENTVRHFFAGAAGGTIACVMTCPLEVVKTRMQAETVHNKRFDILLRQMVRQVCTAREARSNATSYFNLFVNRNKQAEMPVLCAGTVCIKLRM